MISVSPVIMPRRKNSHFVSSPLGDSKPKLISPPLRFQKMITEKSKHYKWEIPESVQANIQNAEREAELEAICLWPEEIKNEFKDLLPDPGTSRGRLSLYHKSLELQWSQKFILWKTLVEKDEHHGEILLQQDKTMLTLHRISDNQLEFAEKLSMNLKPHEQLFDWPCYSLNLCFTLCLF